MRTGLREADIRRLAALLRGGEPWQRVRTVIPHVSPATVESFKALIMERAAEPGPATKLAVPITPEEERERLDAWVEARRAGRKAPVVVVRSVGRARR